MDLSEIGKVFISYAYLKIAHAAQSGADPGITIFKICLSPVIRVISQLGLK